MYQPSHVAQQHGKDGIRQMGSEMNTPDKSPGPGRFFALSNENGEKLSAIATPFVYGTPLKKNYKTWPFVIVGVCAFIYLFGYIYHELPEYRLGFRYDIYRLFGSTVVDAEWVGGNREVAQFFYLFLALGVPTMVGGMTIAVANALPPVPKGVHRTVFRYLKRKILVGKINLSYAESLLILIFLGLNAVWFAAIFGRKMKDLEAQGGADGASTFRFVGYTLGFNAFLGFSTLILPATRNSFWMIAMGVDYSHAIKYHRWIGFLTIFFVFAHAIPYFNDWFKSPDFFANWFPCADCDYGSSGDRKRLQNFFGVVAFLCLIVMGITSLYAVRRKFYELFYYSHHLFIVVLFSTCIHSSSFVIWMYPGICLYMMHRILARTQGGVPCEVVDMEAIPGEITRLVFRRSPGRSGHYHAGQFVYLRVPLISQTQWHPFSISSSPIEYEDTFTVHAKCIGDFTKELYAVAIQARQERKVPLIYVDGYYGKMSDDFQHYPVLVMVAGGIGATPIISMIGKILDCMRNNDPVMSNTVVYWHWTSREIGIFHEFEPLLDAINQFDPEQKRFKVRLCFTGDQHLGSVSIPNGVNLKPMDDTSMVPTRPFHQSVRSAGFQMLLFFVTFSTSFLCLFFMRLNYPILGENRKNQYMWPLQRVLECVVMLAGAASGWFIAILEPKPRPMSRVDKTGMMGGMELGMTKRDSDRDSHSLSFDGQEVQFNHPVTRARLNVKELMAQVVKEQSHNFAINVTGIGTWVSGPMPLIHAVEHEANNFAGIFDVHYEEFEM
ncbi:hypothetical protein Poli38472_000588 [Pythium oligandrum]|uniref:FAD-binding FR-type domain-containing protein n=1 Tax=Pythium oligandrum TaxID=41045 RepID=A0A8K1CC04_PYTOL|nr:hypothetical protein Poli38472_000588 [Pythium oligandrum]|eukprot:TMW60546.1 hypothetical protein Poli38472_000588 [Pythium oligandrum]